MNYALKTSLVVVITIAASTIGDVRAQTWKAKYLVNSPNNTNVPINGLPPGLRWATKMGLKQQITGKPTTPGTYRVLVYPSSGSQNGDMFQVQITIGASGSTPPPQFYGYLRNPLSFSSAFGGLYSSITTLALAGTGGKVLLSGMASNGGQILYFTSDGENFQPVGKPDSFRDVSEAAAASGNFICLSGDSEFFISNGGNFTTVPPSIYTSQFDPSQDDVQLVSDGTKIYFFQLDDDNATLSIFDTNLFNSQPTLIWVGTASNIDEMDLASAATGGTVTLFALGDKDTDNMVLIRKDSSAIQNVPSPKVASVAYGNGSFWGSSRNGVFKSTDGGINWGLPISNSDAGAISFVNGLFFSPRLGVSANGQEWLTFSNFTEQDSFGIGMRIVSSNSTGNNNLIFFGNRQLLRQRIPSFKSLSIYPNNPPYYGVVGQNFSGPRFELNP
jgi:hypothetical protein